MGEMPNNLNQMIAQSGKSKAQVAQEKGLTPETLSRHIHSKIQITLKDAEEYAEICGCSVYEILFITKPVPIIGKAHIHNPNIVLRDFTTTEKRFGNAYAFMSNTDEVCFMRWSVSDDYTGPWEHWNNTLTSLLLDPIQNNYVHKECFQQMSLCKLAEPMHVRGYERHWLAGILYPQPKNLYTIDMKAEDEVVSNVKLEWATPELAYVTRPELRNIIVKDENGLDWPNADIVTLSSAKK
jgi:hypothetical protein